MKSFNYSQDYPIVEAEQKEQLLAINRELASQVNILLATIEKQELKNSKLITESEKLHKEIEKLKAEYSSLQLNMNNILFSKSWNITAPLRKIMKHIKS